ncbi:MAG: serine hydrolase domain-containing protein [Phenylobacterium sp.]|uniref:serine hydrolase domain-containing protein n=1 Tax=Phenylobacterium sp. TaxID=1871053 RepID=UPI002736048E|nr:serine hydrolase domain-containing protein [Phenylobacterium sp.]MDP3749593.1 serine hydrolase domain-containing protein [Phenylobacterium sp.]
MRLTIKAVLAAVLSLCAAPALAQDQTTSPALIPEGPTPYTSLQRPARPAAPRPAAPRPNPAAATATATPAAPIGVVAALPVTASGARLGPAETLPPAELEAFVDGVVRSAMARDHIAGVTVSVVQNGQVVLKKGYGFASLAPARKVDPDATLFRIGSISKTFTWIALMKEIEAGRIRKDAPVNLYLPEQLQIRDQGFRTPVRIVNLMDHSPGFEDRALGHLFERNFARERSMAEYLRQERPRRVRAPGEVASYSNYGAALAGQAVSYVSGKPYERLIEESILLPAGMRNTSFREPHEPKAGIAGAIPDRLASQISQGYRWTPSGFEARPFEYIGHIAPAGSASSTAADMARYMQLLLNGGAIDGATIYGPGAAQAFRTPLRKTPAGINGWRHGFVDYSLQGGARGFGHDGGTLSFHSNMVVIPHLRLGVFVSTNTDTGGDLAHGLADQVVGQFYAPPQVYPRPGSEALKDRARDFEGYFVGTRRAYRGLESIVGLVTTGMTVKVDNRGRLVTSGFNGARTWVPDGDLAEGRFVSTSGANRLAFSMSGGRVQSFQTSDGGQTFERAGFWKNPSPAMTLAILTGVAAAATLAGIFLRNRREFRETPVQSRASLIQNIQAALWLTMLILFGLWLSRTGDIANVMYGWPGPLLFIASACALVAAALTLATLLLLPAIWRGGRRVDSWTPLRKLAFSVTVLLYSAFAVVLWFWGVLSPWSG